METLNPAVYLKRLAVNRLRSIAYLHWSDSGVSSYPIEKFATDKGPTPPMFPVRLDKALSLLAQARSENMQNLLEQTTRRSPGAKS